MAKCKPWLLCLCICALVVILIVVIACVVGLAGSRVACPSGGYARAAVAADSRLCSEIGRDMLLQGGSAVDGTIAALLCTALVNPHSMGLGGGSIVTIRDKTGKVKVYNFRETTPQVFKTNLLNDCPSTPSQISGSQWIGVPGELRGYETIHKQYGRLHWSKLFEPVIKLARDGIPMPTYLGKVLQDPKMKRMVETSALCEVFCNNNRTVLNKGETLKYTKLAQTLETIAEKGAESFYSGQIGHDLIQDVKEAGGTLSMEDLAAYKVRVEDPWTVPLGDAQMYIPPPPAGGALVAFILKLMEGFSLTPESVEGDHKVQMYHRYIEAMKFANGQKRSICDPSFHKDKSAAHLINSSFINHIRQLITSNSTHDDSYYSNTKLPFDQPGTTHVSVLDEDGLAVSATSTINQLFGGSIYSSQTGIILNNELADFCKRADTVKPGEQPPSSMTPTILESKSGRILVIGGSGGSKIITAVALSMMNHLWLGMNLTEAISAPIINVNSKNNVEFEALFDKTVIDGLTALGHRVGPLKLRLNAVNALEKDSGCILAFSDKRKDGQVAGY